MFPTSSVARLAAQGVQLQLAELGLEIEIRPFGEHATASSYLGRLGDADEPWDLGLVLWTPDFVDPAAYINRLLDGQHAGGTNLARFDEPPFNAQMQQASRLRGAAREKAYAELDLRLARDAAPLAADRRPQRGDARLGTRAETLHVAAARVSCSRRSASSGDAAPPGLACLAAPSLLAVAVLPGAQASTDARAGGIFRVSFQGSSSLQAFDHVDPALAYTRESWTLLDTVCARLMRYRDRPPPAGLPARPRGRRRAARRSRADGQNLTTFKLRTGFRFSDGRPVAPTPSPRRSTARWPRASTHLPTLYTQAIVGAEDVHAGRRAARVRCRRARGNTLAVRFTRDGARLRRLDDHALLLRRPADPPARARKASARSPAPAPTPIREYRPNERIVTRPQPLLRRRPRPPRRRLRRRPQRRLTRGSARPDRSRQGRLGVHAARSLPSIPSRGLIGKYGLNYSRFQVRPGLTVAMFVSQLLPAALQGQPAAAPRGEPRVGPDSVHQRDVGVDG